MNKFRLFVILGLGFTAAAASSAAQERLKTTSRTAVPGNSTKTTTGRSSVSTSSPKLARVPNTKSGQSAGKTPRSSTHSVTPQTAVPDVGSAAALQAMEVEQVRGLEQERVQADLKKDRGWFEYHLADDLTSTTADGVEEDKTHAIASSLDGNNAISSETYDELNVRSFGDVIVATGRISQSGKNNGSDYTLQRRFTHVWTNQTGRWQQVVAQTSPVRNVTMSSPAPSASPAEPQASAAPPSSASPVGRKAAAASSTSSPSGRP